MQGRSRRLRKPRLRRAAPVGALLSLLVASGCSQSSPEPAVTHLAPLADTALTPSGWSPVGLGAVQVSVPSGWTIEDPGYTCMVAPEVMAGVIFINQAPHFPADLECSTPTNVVEMSTASGSPLRDAHSAVINSIAVSEATTASGSTSAELIRALGVEVEVSGPLSSRIVGTLTHSPLSVVLDSSVSSVPAGWQHVTFGGIQFAVPGGWTIERDDMWPGCPYNIASRVLELSTATSLFVPFCPAPPETAGYLSAHPGMVLGAGPQVSGAPAGASCLKRNDLRICVDPPPPSTGGFPVGRELNLLTAQITVPNPTTVDQIEIGLTGSGLTPLQIFDSMRSSD